MAKKSKPIIEEGKDFFIMNKDAKFFMGLYGGELLWTDKIDEAKSFKDERKMKVFDVYNKHEQAQIVYI